MDIYKYIFEMNEKIFVSKKDYFVMSFKMRTKKIKKYDKYRGEKDRISIHYISD